jgi:hypothetical protein
MYFSFHVHLNYRLQFLITDQESSTQDKIWDQMKQKNLNLYVARKSRVQEQEIGSRTNHDQNSSTPGSGLGGVVGEEALATTAVVVTVLAAAAALAGAEEAKAESPARVRHRRGGGGVAAAELDLAPSPRAWERGPRGSPQARCTRRVRRCPQGGATGVREGGSAAVPVVVVAVLEGEEELVGRPLRVEQQASRGPCAACSHAARRVVVLHRARRRCHGSRDGMELHGAVLGVARGPAGNTRRPAGDARSAPLGTWWFRHRPAPRSL